MVSLEVCEQALQHVRIRQIRIEASTTAANGSIVSACVGRGTVGRAPILTPDGTLDDAITCCLRAVLCGCDRVGNASVGARHCRASTEGLCKLSAAHPFHAARAV